MQSRNDRTSKTRGNERGGKEMQKNLHYDSSNRHTAPNNVVCSVQTSPLERGYQGEISCADLPCSYTLRRSEGAQPWAREARQDLFTESRRKNLGLLLHLARAAQEAWPSLGRWRR